MRAVSSYIEPTKKVNKGDFERACERWLFATVFLTRGMGKAGRRSMQIAALLHCYINRREFHKSGRLLSYPSLFLLALRSDLDAKTVRRAIADLVGVDLVRVRHRFEETNFYHLVVPAEAAKHLAKVDAIIAEWRKERDRQRAPKCPDEGQIRDFSFPSVQQPLNIHSELHSNLTGTITNRADNKTFSQDKMLSEEGRNGHSLSLNQLYREARELGPGGASVLAKAISDWSRSNEDIRAALDAVREDGGSVEDFASALWEGHEL